MEEGLKGKVWLVPRCPIEKAAAIELLLLVHANHEYSDTPKVSECDS